MTRAAGEGGGAGGGMKVRGYVRFINVQKTKLHLKIYQYILKLFKQIKILIHTHKQFLKKINHFYFIYVK